MFHSFENELRAGAKHMIFEERSGDTEYSHDRRVQALKMTYVHFSRKQLNTSSSAGEITSAIEDWDQFYYKNRRDYYVKRVGEKLAEGPTAKEYMSFALNVYNFERKMTKQYIAEASFKKSQDELLEGNYKTSKMPTYQFFIRFFFRTHNMGPIFKVFS